MRTVRTTSPSLTKRWPSCPSHERRHACWSAPIPAPARRPSCITSPTLGLEYSIGFPPAGHRQGTRSKRSRPRRGAPPSIPTAHPRDGAQVAELTAWMPVPTSRPGPRHGPRPAALARHECGSSPVRERPSSRRPIAADRRTTGGGSPASSPTPRVTRAGRLAALEVRHRQRARCRRPDPRPEGHRNAEPALPRLRPEPDLARGRRARHRPAHLDPNPGLRHQPSQPAAGNPNDSAYGSSPSPAASSAPAAEDASASPATGPGTTSSTPAGHNAPHRLNSHPQTLPPSSIRRTGEHSAGDHPHARPPSHQPRPINAHRSAELTKHRG